MGRTFTKFKGSYWMLVFHHNHTESATFDSKEEAMSSNSKGKYSILNLLNDEYRTLKNGSLKYEFIINWPNLSHYYQWRQTKNPLNEDDILGVPTVEGYEPIDVKLKLYWFGGLAMDRNFSNALLNGCIGHLDWWESIGMLKTAYDHWIRVGIPASDGTASVVDLWIKTPFHSFASHCKNYRNSLISSLRMNIIN
jgi:hypothetical protein